VVATIPQVVSAHIGRQGTKPCLTDERNSLSTSSNATHNPKFIAFAVPFLGILGAIQGSAPNVNSTALVSVRKALDLTGGGFAFAASAQTIAIAATVITTGLLAERLGRRRVLMVALLVGAAGSLITAASTSSIIFFIGQLITGVGMGAVYGSAFGFIQAVAKQGKLAAALGLFGATVGLTTVFISFGGAVLIGVNWRFGYVLFVALSVLAFLLTPIILPTVTKIKTKSLDLFGQLVLGVGIIAFLYGVSQLGVSLTAPGTTVPLAVGFVLLAGFFIFEAKSKGAFYPVRLFRTPVFLAAVFAGFIYNFGTAVVFLQTTNLWQYVTDVPTSEIALWQLPLTAAGIVGAIVTGRLMSKGLSDRAALLSGAVIAVTGFVILALVSSQKSFLAFLPGTVLAGAGLVIVSVPFGHMIINSAPPAQFGPVTSSRTTIGQFFYSIGLALATVMVNRLTVGGVTEKLTSAGVQPDTIGTAVTSLNQYVRTGDDPTTKLGKEALADAVVSYGGAFSTVMLVAAALMLIAALVATFLLGKQAKARQ